MYRNNRNLKKTICKPYILLFIIIIFGLADWVSEAEQLNDRNVAEILLANLSEPQHLTS